MRRLVPLLLFLAACGEEPAKVKPEPELGPAKTTSTDDIRVPTTGVSNIQRDHDDLVKEIAALEAAKGRGEAVNQAHVKQYLRQCEHLITATKRALGPEALKMVRARLVGMRKQFAVMQGRRYEMRDEIRTIREMISNARQGIAELPEGYTEAELLDNIGDLELELEQHKKEEEKLRLQMVEVEQSLEGGKTPPPQGDTMFTQELAALRKTKARIEALLGS